MRHLVRVGGEPLCLLLVHTVGWRGVNGLRATIVCQTSPLPRLDLSAPARTLIDNAAAVNNVTGPKHPFPPGEPGLVLASDAEGNVFEAVLKDCLLHADAGGLTAARDFRCGPRSGAARYRLLMK